MAFRSVWTNLFGGHLAGGQALAEDLRYLREARTGFVEVSPHGLSVVLARRLGESAYVRATEAAVGP
jgi:hypothetical protein